MASPVSSSNSIIATLIAQQQQQALLDQTNPSSTGSTSAPTAPTSSPSAPSATLSSFNPAGKTHHHHGGGKKAMEDALTQAAADQTPPTTASALQALITNPNSDPTQVQAATQSVETQLQNSFQAKGVPAAHAQTMATDMVARMQYHPAMADAVNNYAQQNNMTTKAAWSSLRDGSGTSDIQAQLTQDLQNQYGMTQQNAAIVAAQMMPPVQANGGASSAPGSESGTSASVAV